MAVVLVRIDDRLIHGQIIEGWLGVICTNFIVIVNDTIAKDNLQCVLYSISVPTDIKVECLDIETASKKILGDYFKNDRVLLLFSKPQDVLKLIKQGVKISSVNVGGLHYSVGKKQILKNLSVDEKDISTLKEIASYGIEIEARALPMDERINVMDLIKKIEENK